MATYAYSFELKDKELCYHDIIIFKTYNEEIRYKVLPSFLSCISNKPNDYIFKVLDIKNKAEFCEECYGYKSKYPYELDFFPQCRPSDYKALTTVTFVLLNLCEEQFGEKLTNKPILKPLYQVGDKIIIKKEYDSGCNCENYPYGFSLCMLKKYGGKVGVIKNIINSHPDVESCKMFIEPFYYEIEIDGMKCPEVFSASMFEGKKFVKELFNFQTRKISNAVNSVIATAEENAVLCDMSTKTLLSKFADSCDDPKKLTETINEICDKMEEAEAWRKKAEQAKRIKAMLEEEVESEEE